MENYNFLNRVLHSVSLNNKFVPEMTYNIEKSLFQPIDARSNVYITGLARAGTTTFLNGLHSSGEFASLTYLDMPFLLAPNLWAKLTSMSLKSSKPRERAHQDGVMVSAYSPEALEEVFWKLHCDYYADGKLNTHVVDDEVLEELQIYQGLICRRYNKKRYLSKNNNMLLRIKSLSSRLQHTNFIILFREPHSHALSLLNQHHKFLRSGKFTKKYMSYLSHHEFGETYKPFDFSIRGDNKHNPNLIEYWIEVWANTYSYALSLAGRENIRFVCYEDLCTSDAYWSNICNFLEIKSDNPFKKNKKLAEVNISDQRAHKIYEKLSLNAEF